MKPEHIPEEQLALYPTGDLPAVALKDMKRHLEDCADCRATLEKFGLLQELLARSAPEPSENDLSEVRLAVIARIPKLAIRRKGWTVGAAAAAAIAAICLLQVFRPAPRKAPRAP